MKVPAKDQSLRDLQKGGELCGKVKVPGDKSISHRALLFGAIAKGKTIIDGLLPAEDPLSTAECLRAMGVKISPIKKGEIVYGVGLNGLKEPQDILNCGNSGTTMRLIMGLLAGQEDHHFILTGDKSLRNRPMKRVGQPLKMMGAKSFLKMRWRLCSSIDYWEQIKRYRNWYSSGKCSDKICNPTCCS